MISDWQTEGNKLSINISGKRNDASDHGKFGPFINVYSIHM